MKLPYMKLYIGDWTADTLDYDATDNGAYHFLIAYAWRNGGMIRVADLRRIARCPARSWPRVKRRIEHAFDVIVNDGFWTHHRVMQELQAAHLNIENKRKAGKQMQSNRRARAQAAAEQTHIKSQSELVRTKTVTREPHTAVARNGGSGGGGSRLSQADQDRLIAAYERRYGKTWFEATKTGGTISEERPPKPK